MRPVEIGKEREDPVAADDVTVSTSCKLQKTLMFLLIWAGSSFGAPAATGNILNFGFCGFVSRYPRQDLLFISQC